MFRGNNRPLLGVLWMPRELWGAESVCALCGRVCVRVCVSWFECARVCLVLRECFLINVYVRVRVCVCGIISLSDRLTLMQRT